MDKKERQNRTRINVVGLIVLLALFAVSLFSYPKQGQAVLCICVCAISPAATDTIALINSEHQQTKQHFGTALPLAGAIGAQSGYGSGELGEHEDFLMGEMFHARFLQAMQMMSEQMTAVMMHQMLIIGSFIDAKHNLKVRRYFDELRAEASRDYHPSVAMCEFGTGAGSLASTEHNATLDAFSMGERLLERQLGTLHSNASQGPDTDRMGNRHGHEAGRLGLFRTRFCDFKDNNKSPSNNTSGLFMCPNEAGIPIDRGFVHKDIDYNRTLMLPRVVNLDFSEDEIENSDHAALFEMGSYLYGHDVFGKEDTVFSRVDTGSLYLDIRSVIAKRNVAQNTFSHLVALKSRGTDGQLPNGSVSQDGSSVDTGAYMKAILKQLGGPTSGNWDEAAMQGGSDENMSYNRYLTGMTDTNNPISELAEQMSYYAQMEFLAKKLYQRPEFYTNLYDKPANIKRQGVAMQAVGLMLDRDIYESYLRSEMLLSMILELKIKDEHHDLANQLGQLEK